MANEAEAVSGVSANSGVLQTTMDTISKYNDMQTSTMESLIKEWASKHESYNDRLADELDLTTEATAQAALNVATS